MKNIKKYLGLIIVAVVIIITACRIIYVNVTYPSGKIKYISIDDDMNYGGVSFNISNHTIYSKAEWHQYLKSQNIDAEEKAHKLLYGHVGSGVNISDYDYYVNYNPDEDYFVLTIDIWLNTRSEEIAQKFINNIEVSKSFDTYEYYNDDYYVNKLTEKENDVKDGYTRIKRVYIMDENPDKLYMSCRELGNNLMVRLR